MKRFSLAMILLFAFGTALTYAAARSLEQAQNLATIFLKQRSQVPVRALSAGPDREAMKLVYAPSASQGSATSVLTDAPYYVFAPSTGDAGFVIISGEDSLGEVVGYSDDAEFAVDYLPDALAALLADYASLVDYVRSGNSLPDAVDSLATEGSATAISPMVKSQWGQDDPYNLLCPTDCVSGCVATAMAQLMRYYKYPAQGRGTASPASHSLTADLSQSTYRWSSILHSYDADYTDAEAQAVALLVRDAGYAVAMNYSPEASGAYPQSIASALVRHFGYSTDVQYCDRRSWTTAQWIKLIRENLAARRPVIYNGQNETSGHTFLLDGIDEHNFYHINWGWGGLSNGYFDMNVLSPANIGVGVGEGAFYRYQSIVANIKPGDASVDNSTWLAPLTLTDFNVISGTMEKATGRITAADYLTFTVCNTSGSTFSAQSGVLHAVGYDAEGSIVVDCVLNPTLQQAYSINYKFGMAFDEDGTYTVGIRYTDAASADPGLLRRLNHGPTLGDITVVRRDGVHYLTGASYDGGVELVEASITESLYRDTYSTADLLLSLRNTSDRFYDIAGSYVYLFPATGGLGLDKLIKVGEIDAQFYPGMELDLVVQLQGLRLTETRYRLLIANVTSADARWFDVEEAPTGNFMACERFDFSTESVVQDKATPMLRNYTLYSREGYVGPIEMWAHDLDAATDFLLDRFDIAIDADSTIDITEQRFTAALHNCEPGDYRAYLKYADADSTRLVYGANNEAFFTVVANPSGVDEAASTGPAVHPLRSGSLLRFAGLEPGTQIRVLAADGTLLLERALPVDCLIRHNLPPGVYLIAAPGLRAKVAL